VKQFARWAVSAVLTAFVALAIWTVYTNVLADDGPVRTRAENLAKETCGSCTLTRVEGERGVLKEVLTYTFDRATVAVTCKRPYIAFGDVRCTAVKR